MDSHHDPSSDEEKPEMTESEYEDLVWLTKKEVRSKLDKWRKEPAQSQELTVLDEDADLSYTKVQNIPPYNVNFTIISDLSIASWKAINNDWSIEQMEEEVDRNQLIFNARKTVEEDFSIEKSVKNIERIYDKFS